MANANAASGFMSSSMGPFEPHGAQHGGFAMNGLAGLGGMHTAPPRAGGASILKRTVQIPNGRVGTVIGKQGTTIAQIERMAGVSASVEKVATPATGPAARPGDLVRNIHLEAHDLGPLDTAEQLIAQLLADQIDGRLLARGIVQPVSKPSIGGAGRQRP